LKKPFEVEQIIKAVKKLDEQFVKEKKTGHFIIKASYYEGGRASAIKEESEGISVNNTLLPDDNFSNGNPLCGFKIIIK
jgi:hypothetical protein